MNKRIIVLVVSVLFSIKQISASTHPLVWDVAITDYSTALQSLVDSSNHGDIIEFESGKIYPFNKSISVDKGLTFTTSSLDKAILSMMASQTEFFKIINSLPDINRVIFNNIELDGNEFITKAITGKFDACLIRSYGKKVSVIDCVLRDGENGIRGQVGYALHGLKVENTDFYEIVNICILILNRQTKTNRIEELTEKFEVVGSRFHPGYQRGIISDCGNDFEDVDFEDYEDAQKRYTYATDLKESYIYDNDFSGWNKWCIGFVQSKNVIIDSNRMTNQAVTAQSYNGTFHFEQFVSDIRVSNNIMTNNISGAATFIDMAGGEAKRRYQNVPEFITRDLEDGTIGTCQPGDMYNNDQENLDCRPKPHTYGQRRIYIFGNTFNADHNVNLDYAIAFHEVEDVYVGRKQDESIHNNVWNIVNIPAEGLIKITKFDLGVCNVKVDEPTGVTVGYKIVYTTATKTTVSLDEDEDCIQLKLDYDNLSTENVLSKNYAVFPNPVIDFVTIAIPSSGISTVQIYNLVGSKVFEKNVAYGDTLFELNMDEFQSGAYIIKILSDTKIEWSQLVIKK